MPRRSTARSRRLRDRFIGHDRDRIEDIWQVAYRGGFYRGGPVLMSALAGLEQALVGPEGQGARPAGLGDARRARCATRSALMPGSAATGRDEIAEAAKARRRAGLLRGQDERHRRARLDRHARSCSTRWSSGSRRRRRRAWTSGSTSTAASTGRWPSSSPRRSSRSGCCSSRSRCCPRIRKGCAQIAAADQHADRARRAALFALGLQAVLRERRGRHHPARPEPRRRHARMPQDRGDGRGL